MKACLVCLLLGAVIYSQAQSLPSDDLSPAFEVASLKPTDPKERIIGMFVWPGGRITATNYTLIMFLHDAYGLEDFQIAGSPKWAGEDRYSLVAIPPADSKSRQINPSNPKLPPPEEELRMLQNLLINRFRLKIHEETREGPVYDLVRGDKPPRFTKAKDEDAFPVITFEVTRVPERPNVMEGINASMSLFAARLAGFMKRPVIDRTGLVGAFDFKFDFVMDINNPVAVVPSLPVAVEELGLKLVASRGPIRYLVIDHAEKPQEN
jgi:uncharacterized protein (TIGR03435 family)